MLHGECVNPVRYHEQESGQNHAPVDNANIYLKIAPWNGNEVRTTSSKTMSRSLSENHPAKKRHIGRFAPSPTGFLHTGSLVAAMASWLDARAQGGLWLLRIEDLDPPREVPGSADQIVATLADLGFEWHGEVVRQSTRHALYDEAFARLQSSGLVYPCACTRREIDEAGIAPDSIADSTSRTAIYPGTCRNGLPPGRVPRAWRMRVPDESIVFTDRASGLVRQNLAREVGDFVIKRADGLWAYQLAVVVDDAEQGVTDIVRGADLLDSTPRQILLQRALGWPSPRTLHLPLVVDAHGEKLAKKNGATAIDRRHPLAELRRAARHLGMSIDDASSITAFWNEATRQWSVRWRLNPVREGKK